MTPPRRWVTVQRPRRATLDVSAPAPARYLADSVVHGLRHGLPARRRLGPAIALAVRGPLPAGALAAALRHRRTHPDPELDRLLDRLVQAWPDLVAVARDLPAVAPPLSAVAVQRSAARTVFVLAPAGRLLLVAKQPGASRAGLDAELAALTAAAGSDIAPRQLGLVGEVAVQEGLRGTALPLPPVRPATAGSLPRGREFDELGAALARLAAATVGHRDLGPQLFAPMGLARGCDLLSDRARRVLAAVARDLAGFDTSVLQHGDLSAQNWMVDHGRFTGLVDWETAEHAGVPGFDVLHAAVSMLEHGVGLVRWSPERVEQSFARAWTSSALFDGVRDAQAASALAAGVPESLLEPLRVAFFARRLGRRMRRPHGYTVGPRVVAAALEVVCRA